MPSLAMLGRIRLEERDGAEVDALQRQPKRMALLAYLALPRPGAWHRRDTLLSIFWPEADAGHARTALRTALYTIRQHLGEGVLRTRGDEEVALDPSCFDTDVARLEAAVASGDWAAALAEYGGELLPGLFVPEAEGFEKWLDLERERIRGLARRAADALSQERESAGDLSGAVEAATRAVELDPDDEPGLRRLMTLLERSGAPAQAVAGYERFRARIAREYGAEPSAATRDLAEQLRGGGEAGSVPPVRGPVTVPAPVSAVVPPVARPVWRRVLVPALLVVAALVGATLAVQRFRTARAESTPRSLIVLPVENATGDTELDWLGAGIAEDLAARLSGLGGLTTVRSAARAGWPRAIVRDLDLIEREFGAELALRTRLTREADSLAVTTEVVDLTRGTARSAGTFRFTAGEVGDLQSRLAAAVAGAVFRRPIPMEPRAPVRPVDPESYRLTLQGWHQLLTVGDGVTAARLFTEATRLDPTNARAWAGVSSAWASMAVSWRLPFDEGYELAEVAARRAVALDSLQGTAWANMAILHGLRNRSLTEAENLLARAVAAEPGNPEIFLVRSALYRHAWQWDAARDAIRIARQLDPLNARYVQREAVVALCAGRPAEAEALYRTALQLDPSGREFGEGLARALARQGRWDEALAELGAPDRRGEAAYWALQAELARRPLEALVEESRRQWVSRARLATFYIAAGDVERGLDLLEAEARVGDVGLLRMPCHPNVDRVRSHPRFIALLELIEQRLPR